MDLKFGLYVLLLLPGFIWVQVYEHFLLREKKDQFVKTLEIILWSAAIWAIAYVTPLIFPEAKRIVTTALEDVAQSKPSSLTGLQINTLIKDFAWVCFWTLIVSIVCSIIRKRRKVDARIKQWTGRDWYPSVGFRFFYENIDRPVEVIVAGKSYIGILHSAPDTLEDNYIILRNVGFRPYPNPDGRKLEGLSLVEQQLIKIENIIEMRALNDEILNNDKAFQSKL